MKPSSTYGLMPSNAKLKIKGKICIRKRKLLQQIMGKCNYKISISKNLPLFNTILQRPNTLHSVHIMLKLQQITGIGPQGHNKILSSCDIILKKCSYIHVIHLEVMQKKQTRTETSTQRNTHIIR